MKIKIATFILFSVFLLLFACQKDDNPKGDLAHIPYYPESYVLDLPKHFPQMYIPADNPLTKQGIELGRHLFYDPILSADSTMSCGSCHIQALNFTDGKAFSTGIDGIEGRRSSMSLINIGFAQSGMFWDGRAKTLEEQALLPVEDPVELHNTWEHVIAKLKVHPTYPAMFREAFGIEDRQMITKELAAKAIAQFQRTLISKDSKYDRIQQGKDFFTDIELIGQGLYFDDDPDLPDMECGHCHNTPMMTSDDFFNNGLDFSSTFYDFKDYGRGEATGIPIDNGKFKATSLRNIKYSAPYMHDGRFATLDEVFDHYGGGVKNAPNRDRNLQNEPITPFYRKALLAFIETFEDTTFLNNPAYKNPFE
ncbi:MAG: cytochrome-c peroxidase [Chitinophagales bacterium]|nr:cytochrome-c peroxidase [Chitinophagales bacterium]